MLDAIRSQEYRRILILAILIRLLVMPFYFHPDIKTYNFQASFLKQGIGDIYSYLIANREKLPLKEEFVYFPLTYFSLGGYQYIAQPLLGGGFQDWLNDASQTANERVGVFRYLFILKLPYLILDIAAAFLFLYLFKDKQKQKRAFTLWLFNPLSIALIYIYNNIDILPVFFTVGGLVLAQRNKLKASALTLGIAAGFKAYPMLLLPFLVLLGRSAKERFVIAFVSLGTLLLIILPFLGSAGFRQATLVSGLTTRIVFPGLSIGFGETLMAAIISITALFFFALSKKQFNFEDFWKYQLALLLLIFSFIHFHIQWLLWLMPLATLVLVNKKSLTAHVILLLVFAFAIPLLYEDKFMTVSLLDNISPLYNLLPMPFTAAQKVYDPYVIESVLHSALAGGTLMFIWQMLKGEEA